MVFRERAQRRLLLVGQVHVFLGHHPGETWPLGGERVPAQELPEIRIVRESHHVLLRVGATAEDRRCCGWSDLRRAPSREELPLPLPLLLIVHHGRLPQVRIPRVEYRRPE
jgi:hypothetical protein